MAVHGTMTARSGIVQRGSSCQTGVYGHAAWTEVSILGDMKYRDRSCRQVWSAALAHMGVWLRLVE